MMMILLLVFTYLSLCLWTAAVVEKRKRRGIGLLLGACVVFTPLVVYVFSGFLPDIQKAYCIVPCDTFKVGESYAFMIKKPVDKSPYVVVYQDKPHKFSIEAFNFYFAMVVDDQKVESSKKSAKGIV